MEREEATESVAREFDVYDEHTGHVDHHVTSAEQHVLQGQVNPIVDEASSSGLEGVESEVEPFPQEGVRQGLGGPVEIPPRGIQEDTDHDGAQQPSRGLVREESVRLPRPPPVNCPEKIIICLDLASEVNRVPFLQRDGTKHLPLELIKRALSIFVRTKSGVNPLHQFALVVLQETAVWLHDFTSDVEDFLNVMLDLTNETQDCESCDLTSLFETINAKVELPECEDIEILPPPFTVRTLFFYGRSAQIPEFVSGREAQLALSNSPYFFFDVFYLHEPPSEENCCKDTYDVFLDLDKHNTSYIHEVGRNTTHLYNKMAALVAHPLQRPEQLLCSYALDREQ